MQQQRDDLDNIIANSFEQIKYNDIDDVRYNNKLLSKLHIDNNTGGRFRITAISLITAGILMAFMYTSEVQYGLANIQCKIKTDYSIVINTIKIDKLFLGE